MKVTELTTCVLLLLATASCTSSTGNEEAATKADVARYQQLAVEVQSAATDYRSEMMGLTGMDAAMCAFVHDQYYERALPWVLEMHQNASDMDGAMHMYGAAADYACASETLSDEFEQHHSVACTFGDLSENLAEVQRHVDVMTSYGAHLEARCDDMMGALDGAVPDWGPTMASCEDESLDDECDALHDGMMHGGMMHNEACD